MELDTIYRSKGKNYYLKKKDSKKSRIKYYRCEKIGYIKKNY